MYCHISKQIAENAYKEEIDMDCQEWIENRINELLKGYLNPDLCENIVEALDNLNDDQREIRTALVKFSSINGTAIMRNWVRQWCILQAEQKAIKELNEHQTTQD